MRYSVYWLDKNIILKAVRPSEFSCPKTSITNNRRILLSPNIKLFNHLLNGYKCLHGKIINNNSVPEV